MASKRVLLALVCSLLAVSTIKAEIKGLPHFENKRINVAFPYIKPEDFQEGKNYYPAIENEWSKEYSYMFLDNSKITAAINCGSAAVIQSEQNFLYQAVDLIYLGFLFHSGHLQHCELQEREQ